MFQLALGCFQEKRWERCPCMCPRQGLLQTSRAPVPLDQPRSESCQPHHVGTQPWYFHLRLSVTPECLQESRRLGKEDVRPQRVLPVPVEAWPVGPSTA